MTNLSISPEIEKDQTRFYFRMSSGATLLCTRAEFAPNWLAYVLSRGETYTVEPYSDNEVKVHDMSVIDRDGRECLVWAVTVGGRLVSVEYTVGGTMLTQRKDFKGAL